MVHPGLPEEEGHITVLAGGKATSGEMVTCSDTLQVPKNAMHPFKAHSPRKGISAGQEPRLDFGD